MNSSLYVLTFLHSYVAPQYPLFWLFHATCTYLTFSCLFHAQPVILQLLHAVLSSSCVLTSCADDVFLQAFTPLHGLCFLSSLHAISFFLQPFNALSRSCGDCSSYTQPFFYSGSLAASLSIVRYLSLYTQTGFSLPHALSASPCRVLPPLTSFYILQRCVTKLWTWRGYSI